MRTFFSISLLLLSFVAGIAQSSQTIEGNLIWDAEPTLFNPIPSVSHTIWAFEGASYDSKHPSLPYFLKRFPVNGNGTLTVDVIQANYEAFDKAPDADDYMLSEELQFVTEINKDRQQHVGKVYFIPIRKIGNQYERLTSFRLAIRYTPGNNTFASNRFGNTFNSVLSDGAIYKFGTTTEGVYKLDYNFLKNDLGISDLDNIDPRKIKLYGNNGGALPEANNIERVDDLHENKILIIGEGDGSFDAGDYILLYSQGAHVWQYDSDTDYFSQQRNPFDNEHYYFLKISEEDGYRVSLQNSISNTSYTSNTFDDYIRYEEDIFNLLNEAAGHQGSGRNWYGDIYNPTRERTFDNVFNFPNISNESVELKVAFAGRSKTSSSKVHAKVAGQDFIGDISKVTGEYSSWARVAIIDETFVSSDDNISITIDYPAVGSATNDGWLDYIEMNARRALTMVGDQMIFSDPKTLAYPNTTFQLANANNNLNIWDISDPLEVKEQEKNVSGNQASFGINTTSLKRFVAFNPNGTLNEPIAVGKIDNQNIHETDNVDMVIIYHPDFLAAAQKLKAHREEFSNLDVALIQIDDIFNEFSSGSLDPTAIRDFTKMVYERNADRFKYLLLFGDGSFDYKNINNGGKNFIPVYETAQSLGPISAFPSDDFFTLLSEDEGAALSGDLDIAVGRLPVRTSGEANSLVDKIINYDSNPETLRDWRNRVVYCADDEDGNKHVSDADLLARSVASEHCDFNIDKIYLDAYQQIATPGGDRYPDAQTALNNNMFKGALVVNYMGHGGPVGWAQERVLGLTDIGDWSNFNSLPLFITATCTFAGYDEPSSTSGGEMAILNPNGGAIALFTTVRAVYANANLNLAQSVFDTIFQEVEGLHGIGEVLRIAKNNTTAGVENTRKFTLLGDPAMELALPKQNIETLTINNHDVSDGIPDTIQALQQVTITGRVTDFNGNFLSSFNGKVYPTIFDKAKTQKTLAQDGGSDTMAFSLQKNIIFKGVASVTNGLFTFTFIVPKDIDYSYGFGKISYYAEDGNSLDARGSYKNIVIGGANPNAVEDNVGPLVEVYMNTEEFISGGLTDENPTLLVKLSDDYGINVVGNSIGHDLTGVLDQNTQNSYILNDFYESALDDYTKGEVRYPLHDLEEGLHYIKVKAWDISNNSGEGDTEFVVASSGQAALTHVLNYPNPFTTNTNFQFEHNLPAQDLDIQIHVFTVSGKLVKTIDERVFTDGYFINDIQWDGRDDYGNDLGRGVYLYKVKIRSANNSDLSASSESDFEKLVILK